jgi:hypothetical protein
MFSSVVCGTLRNLKVMKNNEEDPWKFHIRFQKQETLVDVKNIQVTWKSLILGFQSLSY